MKLSDFKMPEGMDEEQTKHWERRRRRRRGFFWWVGAMTAVLGLIAVWYEVGPQLWHTLQNGAAAWNAPSQLSAIHKDMGMVTDELNTEAWRQYRIEQKLGIPDSPPKRIKLEEDSFAMNTNFVDTSLAFIKADVSTNNN